MAEVPKNGPEGKELSPEQVDRYLRGLAIILEEHGAKSSPAARARLRQVLDKIDGVNEPKSEVPSLQEKVGTDLLTVSTAESEEQKEAEFKKMLVQTVARITIDVIKEFEDERDHSGNFMRRMRESFESRGLKVVYVRGFIKVFDPEDFRKGKRKALCVINPFRKADASSLINMPMDRPYIFATEPGYHEVKGVDDLGVFMKDYLGNENSNPFVSRANLEPKFSLFATLDELVVACQEALAR